MIENEEVIDLGSRPSALAPTPAPSPDDEPPTAVDVGAEAAFAGPASPFAYHFDTLPGAEVDDGYMADEQGIRQALHAEGIPTGVASLGHMLLQNAVKNGLPDDASLEMGRRTGEAELARRHGEKAQEVIRQARAVFSRLDKRDSRLGDMLVNSGVASNPNFIEALARLHGVRGGR
ncbi:MAG: hypothetical protein BroJett012_18850 [Betaproteobacteria bacterium]|nr:MAG: hypothetical protein BroJett012_18850 [Betaproteobacteria bacterium]